MTQEITQDDKKKAVARAALGYVETGTIIGVGTGSTANYFVDALAEIKHRIDGTVASSSGSASATCPSGVTATPIERTQRAAGALTTRSTPDRRFPA